MALPLPESAPSANPPRRRGWVAFVFALLAPGLGHLYAGSIAGAAGGVLVNAALGGTGFWLATTPFGTATPLVLGGVLALIGSLGVASHAAWAAPRGRPLPFARWLRITLYVLYLGLSIEAVATFRREIGEGFWISSRSMYPTLQLGDYFYLDKTAYRRRPIERGDVVVQRSPKWTADRPSLQTRAPISPACATSSE